MSSIQVEYEYGIDMDEAKRALDIRARCSIFARRSTKADNYGN